MSNRKRRSRRVSKRRYGGYYDRDYTRRVISNVPVIPLRRKIVLARNGRIKVIRAVTPLRQIRRKRVVVLPLGCDRERRSIRRAYFAAGRPRGRGGAHQNRFSLSKQCRRK